MKKTIYIAFLAVSLLGGCDLDVPDLNNPGLGDLENNPDVPTVTSACTGLLIGNRRNQAAENGYVEQLAILGRESYNFDQADPRYIGELLQGELNKGSPFGGNFWAQPYANIRLANLVLKAVDRVPEFSDEDRAGITGFTKTMIALDLLEVIVTHDDIGAVVDTDRELDQPLGPIVDKATVYAKIGTLLDEGNTSLATAGKAFPFAMSKGYAGFDDPAGFAKFNRAIRARVAAYTKDYPTVLTALAASFLDDTAADQAALDVGVYYSYSTGAGDTTNQLINPNIFAHPSIETDAQKKGQTPDARLTRKTATRMKAGSAQMLTSKLGFTVYTGPDSPVPLIRNEELILLKSEALFFTNDVPGAMTALNTVRTVSGQLTAIAGNPAEAAYVDDLLYERRYSLMFEWGHRWIDQRRFAKPLALDFPDHKRNVRFPIPLAECNARPGEPACDKSSVE